MIRVLVGDGQRMMAEALRAALRQADGLEVLEDAPATGLEAVEAAVTSVPDVAVLDYWLKGMEGPAAVRLMLDRDATLKVILLGWFHEPGKVREAAAAGAWGFLSKDVRLPQLVEAIRNVADGRRLIRLRSQPEHDAASEQDDTWKALVSLTKREIEILSCLALTGRPEDVAKKLSVTTGTVRLHIQHILAKTGARSHVEAVVIARQRGLI